MKKEEQACPSTESNFKNQRISMTDLCVQTNLPSLKLFRRGKVRDVYEIGDRLLMIATDRVSAFDVVLPTPIPMKGAVLTKLSRFWFRMM